MTPIKLYGYATSPFVRKSGCFLYYKGINFTHVPVNPIHPEATIGHLGGTQVPILEIGAEWKRESSDHAQWLDELFPEKPLYPAEHRATINRIDQWVSNTFLVSLFRGALNTEINSLQFQFRAWRMAALLSAHTPLPEAIRNQWPEILRQAPFIQNMAKQVDLTESHRDMRQRVFFELLNHLGNGPYFGELNQPSMLDFAIFPQLVWGYMFGVEEKLHAASHPAIKAWIKRVSDHLPENPTMFADKMQINSLAQALT